MNFTIPANALELLKSEINRLNRRATKIGQPMMEIVITKTEWKHDPRQTKGYDNQFQSGFLTQDQYDEAVRDIPLVEMVSFDLIGDAPHIKGYALVGTLDHYTIPGKVIVKTVPGQTVPSKYFDVEPVCDHCNKIRNRKDTFVLYNEQEHNHTVIGRQCVRDFIGYDVAALARHMANVYDLVSRLSGDADFEEKMYEYGGGSVWAFDKIEILTATHALISMGGWTARSSHREDVTPTADLISQFFIPQRFFGPHAEEMRIEHQKWCAEIRSKMDDYKSLAEQTCLWLDDQQPNNEYIHNLKTLNELDVVPVNMFGYWCSAAAAYLRHLEKLEINKKEKLKKVNEWVGEVKQRKEFIVTVVKKGSCDGYWGYSTIYTFLDAEGHTLVWFDSQRNVDLETGDNVTIVGTIKEHDKYNDWKQTKINRVKIK